MNESTRFRHKHNLQQSKDRKDNRENCVRVGRNQSSWKSLSLESDRSSSSLSESIFSSANNFE